MNLRTLCSGSRTPMGLSCLLIALLWGTASVILIPLALCLCLCCIGFTAEGIRLGSSAAFCMSCGDGETPCCVSCCQSLGAKGLSCCTLTCIFLATTIIFLYKCSSVTEYYCESLTTNSTLCYNSTGNSCFTFFGKGYCDAA